jgi:peptidylprolyl isomerase
MTQAKNGNIVKVHYTGKLEGGAVFDTSLEGGDPVRFKIGEGKLISGFEQAVIGMEPGESKTTTVPAEKAFGEHNKEKVLVMNRSQFPADVHVGQQFQIGGGDNNPNVVNLTDVSEESVTVDANHPLAGHDLIFDIELLEIA